MLEILIINSFKFKISGNGGLTAALALLTIAYLSAPSLYTV
jgi:hypothetical protein